MFQVLPRKKKSGIVFRPVTIQKNIPSLNSLKKRAEFLGLEAPRNPPVEYFISNNSLKNRAEFLGQEALFTPTPLQNSMS